MNVLVVNHKTPVGRHLCDVLRKDHDLWNTAQKGLDVVFHIVSEIPDKNDDVDFQFQGVLSEVKNLLANCKFYNIKDYVLITEATTKDNNFYQALKVSIQAIMKVYSKDVKCFYINHSEVVDKENKRLDHLIKEVKLSQNVYIPSRQSTYQCIHINDLVDGIITGWTSACGNRYNDIGITAGEEKLTDVCEEIRKIVSPKKEINFHIDFREDVNIKVDMKKLNSLFYRPNLTVMETVKKYVMENKNE